MKYDPQKLLASNEAERPRMDPDFEEVTEGEEADRKEKLKTKWAQLEAIVGAEKRIRLVAQDIVTHFERRLEAMEGKAMVVCMSRRICVELYREIVKLAATALARRRGVLIYGYDADEWPLEPAIAAFEVLAARVVRLGPRKHARFSDLVHPVHASGWVFAWELEDDQTDG